VLAQLGRHQRQVERRVDLLLGRPGHARPVVHREQAVLVELEASLQGTVAQRDVVGLRPGEVLQRGTEALGRDEPKVGLVAVIEEDARLGVATPEDASDGWRAREPVHDLRRSAGGKDVDVTARLAASTQAAHGLDGGMRCPRAQVLDQGRGHPVGVGKQVPTREASALVERLENEFLLLGAHPLDRAQTAGAGRGLHSSRVEMPSVR